MHRSARGVVSSLSSAIVVASVAMTLVGAVPCAALAQREDAAGLATPRAGAERSNARGDPRANLSLTEGANTAQPSRLPRSWFEASLLVGTMAPVDFGVTARARIAEHILVDLSIGAGIYGGVFGAIARSQGESEVAPVLKSVVNGAFVVRGSFGVRPFQHQGLEFVARVGRMHATETIASATVSALVGTQGAWGDVETSATLRIATLEAAWTIEAGRRFVLRPAIGVLWIRSANVSLAVPSGSSAAVASAFAEVESEIEGDLRASGPSPTVSLALGTRIGR